MTDAKEDAPELAYRTLITWGADQTRRVALTKTQRKALEEAMRDGEAFVVGPLTIGTRNITSLETTL